jgi:hypothetical protein
MDLSKIEIDYGGHHHPDSGTCLMEAISVIAGEEFSDHPKCTAYCLADLGITINDATDHGYRNKVLKSAIPSLLNTSSKERRSVQRDGYDVCNDEHNTAVLDFLNRRAQEEFPTETEAMKGMGLLSQGAVYNIVGKAIGDARISSDREHREAVTKAVKLLKEGAQYAKQLLGKDVSEPVTIYASENVLPGFGDKFVDDMTGAADCPAEVHIHMGEEV